LIYLGAVPTDTTTAHRRGHFEIIAHRGTPRERPENSLPGFRRALEYGANGIELDVHLTADGVIVVHHDSALHPPRDRPAAGGPSLEIRALTYDAILAHPLASGVPVPTLAEVLDLASGRATLYIEVKAAAAAAAVVSCVSQTRCVCAVHGFDHRVALRVSEIAPAIPTGILLDSYLIDPASALGNAHARDYWQRWDMIDADLVARIHAAGGRVIAWTVNDVEAARRLFTLGVDAVCTDVCGTMSNQL
jgi:glycerophosphoryl diester phosphodiesterase